MDGTKTTNDIAPGASGRSVRRRRVEMTSDNVRYFLPRPGSTSEKPELGQELDSEGRALVEAFKSGQVFYTLVAWKAVPELTGSEPKIVKQAVSRS